MDTKQHGSWTLNVRAQKSLYVAAVLTIVAMAVVVFLVAITSSSTVDFLNSLPAIKAVVVAFMILGTVFFFAEIYLWIGMLVFFFNVDRSSKLSKVFWFLALLVANAWAAALYHFLVFRPFVQSRMTRYAPQRVDPPTA